MVFVAWQASGLRAIHSWSADLLFGAPEVRLAYADGPSLFVAGGTAAAGGSSARFVQVEDVVPAVRRERAWEPAALEMARDAWRRHGAPPEEWFEVLRPAPHVLWGWSEFHRLTFDEGLLPVHLKALAMALLAARLGHRRWTAGLVGRGGPAGLTVADVAATEAGDLERFDPKTRAALTYVGRLEGNYLTVDDRFMADVAGALSPGELVEIGMFAGLHLGSIRLARLAAA